MLSNNLSLNEPLLSSLQVLSTPLRANYDFSHLCRASELLSGDSRIATLWRTIDGVLKSTHSRAEVTGRPANCEGHLALVLVYVGKRSRRGC